MSRTYDNFADLITFTRASTATFVGSNGLIQSATTNTPRIDFDPVTNDRKGFLIEEARTNEITQSEALNSLWTSTNITATADSATSPDGTNNAYELTEDASTGVQFALATSKTVTGSETFAYSFFVKRGTGTDRGFRLEIGSGSDGFRANFNPDTGTASSTSTYGTGSVDDSGSEDFGNGWRRYYIVGSVGTAGTANIFFRFLSTASGATIGYTGDGTQSFYVFGAQLEEGSFPTSYIPTSGATATRSADVASIATSAFGFNEDEGTFFAEGATFDDAGSAKTIFFADKTGGVFTDRVWLYASVSEAMKFEIEDNNVSQATIVTGSVSLDTFAKFAGSYQENNSAFSNAGASPNTDTSCTIPKLDTLTIGSYSNSTNFWNGHIKKLQYFPRRLSDTQLQEVTS